MFYKYEMGYYVHSILYKVKNEKPNIYKDSYYFGYMLVMS